MSGLRGSLIAALLAAGAALAVAVLSVLLAEPAWGMAIYAALAAAAVGAAALWAAATVVSDHFRRLDRLRQAVVIAGRGVPLPAPVSPPRDELDRLHQAAADLIGRWRTAEAAPDERLAAVLASLRDGVVVITAEGQVSLTNGPARALLGAEAVAIGTSVFAALERESVSDALAAAAGGPVEVTLRTVAGRPLPAVVTDFGEHGGAVLSFPAAAAAPAAVEHDLGLHDRPPPPPPLAPELPLADLPAVVLDSETTGLDVRSDRLLALGAVRLHGERIYRAAVVDMLVNPQTPIPAAATAVHGITDAMMAAAAPFAEALAAWRRLADGCLVIGHNIGFDMAILGAEAARRGLPWQAPPTLDTGLIVAALDPALRDLNLESIAAHLDVSVSGRHTALGDALVTAEIWVRLLPLLAEAGITTLAGARALAARPTALIERQRAAGW